MDTGDGAEREIQGIVEEGFGKWREAKQRANPHGYITAANESEMRQCIVEYERAKRGLPLESGKQQSSAVEWNVFTYLDAQQSQIAQPPWKIRGLVVEGGATQISAHPHGMKSLSWLNAALESVTLHTVWRHFDASNVQSVLFIESEVFRDRHTVTKRSQKETRWRLRAEQREFFLKVEPAVVGAGSRYPNRRNRVADCQFLCAP